MWAKVDDSFVDNPKLQVAATTLGREGLARVIAIYMGGLCYAARNLTDGYLGKRIVAGFAYASHPLAVAEALVTAGLWETVPNGFRIHDYHEYNPTAGQVKEKRARDRLRKIEKDSARNPRGSPRGIQTESTRNPERPAGARGTGSVRTFTEKENGDKMRAELDDAESVRWFDKIYGIFPNKDRKHEANRAWVELSPDLATAQAIFADVQRRVQAGWKRYERRFIPQLKTYLSDRMWEDANEGGLAPFEEAVEGHGPWAWQCGKCGEIHEGTEDQSRRRLCLKSPPAMAT